MALQESGRPPDARAWPRGYPLTRPFIGFWPWVVVLLVSFSLVEPPPPLLGRVAALVTMALLAWPSWRVVAWMDVRIRTLARHLASRSRRADRR